MEPKGHPLSSSIGEYLVERELTLILTRYVTVDTRHNKFDKGLVESQISEAILQKIPWHGIVGSLNIKLDCAKLFLSMTLAHHGCNFLGYDYIMRCTSTWNKGNLVEDIPFAHKGSEPMNQDFCKEFILNRTQANRSKICKPLGRSFLGYEINGCFFNFVI